MGLHPISAGHGYTYLTSQTMAGDGAPLGPGGLASYYSERGEAPGRWLGSGLDGADLKAGALVSEPQMIALFGDGRHPLREEIAGRMRGAGAADADIALATELGRPFTLNVGNSEFRQGMAQLAREWNVAEGRRPDDSLPEVIRSRIRTAVGGALYAKQHGHEAADARELSDFVAVVSRRGSKAVAGFDLTFSPVKSVSALWALAGPVVAREIEAAHDAAVRDTIKWLEDVASYTRLGRNGVRQVETRGLIAAAFIHRTSRAGDPDLHTHVAVSNKVQTLDGRWRALDGRVLFKAAVAASERYNTRLQLEMHDRLGTRFVDVERRGRRPVREIAGIDPDLIRAWSSRRAAIDARRADLATAFQQDHERAPTPVEAIALAQQATLETRPDKPAPGSEAEQRRRWRAEAAQVVGSERAVDAMVRQSLLRARGEYRRPVDVRRVAFEVVGRLAAERATWQQWHVLAEAQRMLRREHVTLADHDRLVAAVVGVALDEASIRLSAPATTQEPDSLRRTDGSSVYTVAGAQLYTSQPVLGAEQTILSAARRQDGRRLNPSAVDVALLEASANGLQLNSGQLDFVRALTTSGDRVQLALAPAGSGKTTAMRVVARAWSQSGGDVVALAPSAAAAQVLGEALDLPSDTLAKAVLELGRGRMRLSQRTLVVLDEAGMAGTPELAALTRSVLETGASLRLVGDDRQLSAVGAGGVLRDLAETVGATSLSAAVRFADPDEADAAALVRRGDNRGLSFYLERGRVQVGDDQSALASAFEAWRTDRGRGLDTVLLASTRAEVRRLNELAQAAVLGRAAGAGLALADGTRAYPGDTIVTRRNDRRLAITATDWVKNGDVWTVDQVRDSGDLLARHRETGRLVAIPDSYARADVELGYATTVHGAQGSTADTCHLVVRSGMSREQLYVGLSRGRYGNTLHVAVAHAADDHAAIRPDVATPPAARDVLVGVLTTESAARSATTELRQLADPRLRLREMTAQYLDALGQAPTTSQRLVPAPLPWLPDQPVPTDPAWAAYLDECGHFVSELARQVRADAADAVAAARPGTSLSRRDPELHAAESVVRAAHDAADVPEAVGDAASRYLDGIRRRLEERTAADDSLTPAAHTPPPTLDVVRAPEPSTRLVRFRDGPDI